MFHFHVSPLTDREPNRAQDRIEDTREGFAEHQGRRCAKGHSKECFVHSVCS